MFTSSETTPELCAALTQHRLTHVYQAEGASLRCPRTVSKPLSDKLRGLLAGNDAEALARALRQDKGAALAVAPGDRGKGLLGKLSRYVAPTGLRAIALAPELAVYAPGQQPQLAPPQRQMLFGLG